MYSPEASPNVAKSSTFCHYPDASRTYRRGYGRHQTAAVNYSMHGADVQSRTPAYIASFRSEERSHTSPPPTHNPHDSAPLSRGTPLPQSTSLIVDVPAHILHRLQSFVRADGVPRAAQAMYSNDAQAPRAYAGHGTA